MLCVQVIFKVVEEHPRDLAEGLDMIKVVYGDESIPSLYENSRISQEQLPGQPGLYLGLFLFYDFPELKEVNHLASCICDAIFLIVSEGPTRFLCL